MANNRFAMDGLAELKAALRNLPKELQAESSAIVYANADKARDELRAEYAKHTRTGNLANHVTVSKRPGQFGAAALVKNTAKHAHLFENGTQARHTDIGANRGAMPAGHVFVPIMIRRRRVMYEVLKELLVKHGLIVSGDAT